MKRLGWTLFILGAVVESFSLLDWRAGVVGLFLFFLGAYLGNRNEAGGVRSSHGSPVTSNADEGLDMCPRCAMRPVWSNAKSSISDGVTPICVQCVESEDLERRFYGSVRGPESYPVEELPRVAEAIRYGEYVENLLGSG